MSTRGVDRSGLDYRDYHGGDPGFHRGFKLKLAGGERAEVN
jgi:hypothetical protein